MNLSEEDFKQEQKHLELTTKLLRENISNLAHQTGTRSNRNENHFI